MQMNKLIINADDFGYSENNNKAIEAGYKTGLITSASLIANMNAFEHALKVIDEIQGIDIGFHFNIMEGKSLSGCKLLCDSKGYFSSNYLTLMFNSNNKDFLYEIEQEFRVQLEKILKYHIVSHIDSHVHIHAIPNIFKLVVKLAQEYNIKYIRTQKEQFYLVKDNVFNTKFPINILKNILLNKFSNQNKIYLANTNIKTNDRIIGVLYTGNMTEDTILEGIKAVKNKSSLTEVLFHPYFSQEKINNYKEFLITQNNKFKEKLSNLDFELTNYSS